MASARLSSSGAASSSATLHRSFTYELSRVHINVLREALEGIDASKQYTLLGDLEDPVDRFNRSGDETMMVPSDYLELVAIRR